MDTKAHACALILHCNHSRKECEARAWGKRSFSKMVCKFLPKYSFSRNHALVEGFLGLVENLAQQRLMARCAPEGALKLGNLWT